MHQTIINRPVGVDRPDSALKKYKQNNELEDIGIKFHIEKENQLTRYQKIHSHNNLKYILKQKI